MTLALEDRQTIEMRTDTTHQHVVTIVQQVVRSDGCANTVRCTKHKLHCVSGGDVFEYHFESSETFGQRYQLLVDEGLFTIKDIDVRMGYFAVYQQRHAYFGHCFQSGIDLFQCGYT